MRKLFNFLHLTEFILTEKERISLCNDIIADHLNYAYGSCNSYELEDKKYSQFSDNLYDFFIKKSKEIYKFKGEFVKQSCWAYVSNEDDYDQRNGIHNHVKTSTINGVYYLNVPSPDSGKIAFFNKDKKKIFEHQPKNFDLIIMPNFMNHRPEKSLSKDYRIAINVEIIVKHVTN